MGHFNWYNLNFIKSKSPNSVLNPTKQLEAEKKIIIKLIWYQIKVRLWHSRFSKFYNNNIFILVSCSSFSLLRASYVIIFLPISTWYFPFVFCFHWYLLIFFHWIKDKSKEKKEWKKEVQKRKIKEEKYINKFQYSFQQIITILICSRRSKISP